MCPVWMCTRSLRSEVLCLRTVSSFSTKSRLPDYLFSKAHRRPADCRSGYRQSSAPAFRFSPEPLQLSVPHRMCSFQRIRSAPPARCPYDSPHQSMPPASASHRMHNSHSPRFHAWSTGRRALLPRNAGWKLHGHMLHQTLHTYSRFSPGTFLLLLRHILPGSLPAVSRHKQIRTQHHLR